MEFRGLVPDKQIENYAWNLKAILGKGSYGTVYLGKDITTKVEVAIKVMPASICQNDQLLERLKSEVQLMQSLSNPNIVRLINCCYTSNNIYIIQEFCNGGDLAHFIAKKAPLQEKDAVNIISQIVAGMKALINKNVIHRDLKPSNILIHDNAFKITDFGFAKHLDTAKAIMVSFVGTPLQMPPQIIDEKPYTTKCDIWSIGIIFYEMLQKKTPWDASTIQAQLNGMKNIPVLTTIHSTGQKISNEAQDFLKGCLQFAEESRFTWDQVFKHPLFTKQNWNEISPQIVEKPQEQNKYSPISTAEKISLFKEINNFLIAKQMNLQMLQQMIGKTVQEAIFVNDFQKIVQLVNPQLTMNPKLINESFQVIVSQGVNFANVKDFVLALSAPEQACSKPQQKQNKIAQDSCCILI